MSKETWNKYIKEIEELNQESNKISDQIDKEFEFIKNVEKYHKIKQSELPIFKKYNGFNLTWHYKLGVVNGFLTCQKISIQNKGIHELISVSPESIFDIENVESTKEEWHDAVCKVLKSID